MIPNVAPNDLTPDQKAQIALQAAQFANQNKTIVNTTPEQVKQWADVADALANGIGKTAHSLNVEVNEFIKSPVGIMTAVMLFWNYMGKDFLGIIFGTGWLAVSLPIWLFFFWKSINKTETEEHGSGENKQSVTTKTLEYDGGIVSGYLITLAVIIFIGLFTIF
jgi:hypothetical protein